MDLRYIEFWDIYRATVVPAVYGVGAREKLYLRDTITREGDNSGWNSPLLRYTTAGMGKSGRFIRYQR